MKIVRYGPHGAEKPGLIDAGGVVRDLSGHVADWRGSALAPDALARVGALDTETLPKAPDGVRLGAPVAGVRNVVCAGLNYVGHARETGNALPVEPILFNKHTASVSGATDPILLPPGSAALDWEVELAVVIGTPAWRVHEADALKHVAGYCLANDVSERAWQMERAGQWTKGKSFPSWAPLGPYLLTADQVPDPHAIDLWLDVNGVRRQTGRTDDLHFGVAALVAAASELMGLLTGDVILTGTPAGVGQGLRPPVYLKAGDVVTVGSSRLGAQHSPVVAYEDGAARALLARSDAS